MNETQTDQAIPERKPNRKYPAWKIWNPVTEEWDADLDLRDKMHRETRRRAYQRNVLKHRCRAATQYAIKSGKLSRPKACSKCGRDQMRIAAHHEDYSKPLDVLWLCHWCHYYRHEELRQQQKEQL